ncbi:MAG: hypothetical protein ACLP4V_27345, partial [Methylocella sp.]
TKTTEADADARVFLVGRPVDALREWLSRADILKGPVFRAIDHVATAASPPATKPRAAPPRSTTTSRP